MKTKYVISLLFIFWFWSVGFTNKPKDNFMIVLNETWPFILQIINEEVPSSRENIIFAILQKMNDTILTPRNRHILEEIRKKGTEVIQGPLPENLVLDNKISILSTIRNISDKISVKKHLSLPDSVLSRVVSPFIYTGLMEHERIFYLFVVALQSNDFRIQAIGYETLMNNIRHDYFTKYNIEIREGIVKYREAYCKIYPSRINKEYCEHKKDFMEIKEVLPGDELFMHLPLSPVEKKKMLMKDLKGYSQKTADFVSHSDKEGRESSKKLKEYYYRALLGDIQAEDSIIARFEKANTYKDKHKFALKYLRQIGSPGCSKALIRALNTPVKYEDKDCIFPMVYYARYSIIQALGYIHPEVPFIRRELSLIGENGADIYGGKGRVKEFLRRIYSWAEKTYNEKPVEPEPEPDIGGGRICAHIDMIRKK